MLHSNATHFGDVIFGAPCHQHLEHISVPQQRVETPQRSSSAGTVDSLAAHCRESVTKICQRHRFNRIHTLRVVSLEVLGRRPALAGGDLQRNLAEAALVGRRPAPPRDDGAHRRPPGALPDQSDQSRPVSQSVSQSNQL